MQIEFEILQAPIGKGRPKAAVIGGHARVYTPSKTREWEQDLRYQASQHIPPGGVLECPLRVDILAVLPRPKRLMRHSDPDGLVWAPVKPDKDNVEKAVLDGLSSFWRDDSQVVAGECLKVYAEKQGHTRIRVRITDELWWPEAMWRASSREGMTGAALDLQVGSRAAQPTTAALL